MHWYQSTVHSLSIVQCAVISISNILLIFYHRFRQSIGLRVSMTNNLLYQTACYTFLWHTKQAMPSWYDWLKSYNITTNTSAYVADIVYSKDFSIVDFIMHAYYYIILWSTVGRLPNPQVFVSKHATLNILDITGTFTAGAWVFYSMFAVKCLHQNFTQPVMLVL